MTTVDSGELILGRHKTLKIPLDFNPSTILIHSHLCCSRTRSNNDSKSKITRLKIFFFQRKSQILEIEGDMHGLGECKQTFTNYSIRILTVLRLPSVFTSFYSYFPASKKKYLALLATFFLSFSLRGCWLVSGSSWQTGFSFLFRPLFGELMRRELESFLCWVKEVRHLERERERLPSTYITKESHSVWKSQKKSHSTLRAKRATITFWVAKVN